MRMPELEQAMQGQAERSVVLDAMTSISQPKQLARRLGFQRHPLWLEACAKKLSANNMNATAATIVYGSDSESLFASLLAPPRNATQTRRCRAEEGGSMATAFPGEAAFLGNSRVAVRDGRAHLHSHEIWHLVFSASRCSVAPSLEQRHPPTSLQGSPTSIGAPSCLESLFGN